MESKRLRPGNLPKPKVLPDFTGNRVTLRGRKGQRRKARAKARVIGLRALVSNGQRAKKNDSISERLTKLYAATHTETKVSSHAYPGLERTPGGPDNWVEAVGSLPAYIEGIAKHLHYEQGFTISRAIAVAVNTVKRWAAGGTVTEHGGHKVTVKTQVKAAAALAQWEALKAKAHTKK